MCGICGAINLRAKAGELERLTASMARRLHHRGPDASGVWVGGDGQHVSLGHTRLAVLDVAGSKQPLCDPEGRAALVYNGEVYNFKELRQELEKVGRRFVTQGDTEVVLQAWLEWGPECVKRLRGMFAFAIWDSASQSLSLVRDRLGKKPLYYRLTPDGIIFASEIKALLADPAYTPRPNIQAIDRYLQLLYVDGDQTAFEHIHRLPPGACLLWRRGGTHLSKYWHVDLTPKEEMDPVEATEELRRLFGDAVRARLESDVPLGALLSGGLDSSMVVSELARLVGAPIETFSVGFDSLINELPKARSVARQFGTAHHEINVEAPVAELIHRMAEVYDEPFGDSSNIPTFLLTQYARRHVTVALAGDGGDELFAGYHRHLYLWWGENPDNKNLEWEKLLLRLISRLGLASQKKDGEGRYIERARRRVNEVERSRRNPDPWRRVETIWGGMGRAQREKLWRRELIGDGADSAFAGRNGTSSAVQACLEFDLTSYLPGDLLVKMDMASMANSLEVRAPFLDHHLVEFAVQLPFRLRLGKGRTKDFLRRAFANDLPAGIINQKKMGFGAPIAHWLKSPELRDLARGVFAGPSFIGSLFHGARLREIHEEFTSCGARAQDVWSLLNLELWGRRMGFA